MVFINLEKSYNRVPRDLIWRVLNKKSVPRGYNDIIKDMYKREVTRVRTTCREAGEFPVTIGMHRGSALISLH